MRHLAILMIVWPISIANAATLNVPGAEITGQDFTAAGRFAMPNAPWTPKGSTRQIEGATERVAWEIPNNRSTPLQLADLVRAMLEDDGYEIIFECDASECGGFDFRFSLDLLDSPSMFVDLSAYHYLSAQRAGSEAAVLTSRTGASGFIHLTVVGDGAEALEEPDVSPEVELERPEPVVTGQVALGQDGPATPGDVAAQLASTGRVVLADLNFASGSTELDDGISEDLSMLAGWMKDNPESRIALVGHTDSVGGLAANTRLSRARAQSVARRLTEEYGIAANRIEPEGVGYLMPRAPNTSDEGRALNRRVEAVLLDVQ